ncbi:unnamed protein product, partial [Prorocentrum cordatum]
RRPRGDAAAAPPAATAEAMLRRGRRPGRCEDCLVPEASDGDASSTSAGGSEDTEACAICFEVQPTVPLPCSCRVSYCARCWDRSLANSVLQCGVAQCPTCRCSFRVDFDEDRGLVLHPATEGTSKHEWRAQLYNKARPAQIGLLKSYGAAPAAKEVQPQCVCGAPLERIADRDRIVRMLEDTDAEWRSKISGDSEELVRRLLSRTLVTCDLCEDWAGIFRMLAAGEIHTVLLRSDGTAVARGGNHSGQCDLPALPAGLTYSQVAAGWPHTVLLRSDGTAVARGSNDLGQCDLPALPAGLTYTQVAAGDRHTVLLRSDGTAVARGWNAFGQCDLPALPAGLTESDGTAVARGDNDHGQCDLPALPAGLTYTQVAAGWSHTVLLRSDGTAVACGWNAFGQSDLPALSAGLTYTQVAPRGRHTVLLRSDGTAVARGDNDHGQCDLPALPAGLTYTQVSLDGRSMVFVTIVRGCFLRMQDQGGAHRWPRRDIHPARAVHRAGRLGPGAWRVEAILPGGRPLSAAAEETVAGPVPQNRFHGTGSTGPVPQDRYHRTGSISPVPQDCRFHRTGSTGLLEALGRIARGAGLDIGDGGQGTQLVSIAFAEIAGSGDATRAAQGAGVHAWPAGTSSLCQPAPHGAGPRAGPDHYALESYTVLLRSDGTAVARGWNAFGQSDLPALPAGLTYSQVAAGGSHTVLLRSDGTAVARGSNADGRCDLPALPAGLTYSQVAAGGRHAVLLRSDGTAVACGWNDDGQCDLPALPAGLTYTAHLLPALLLQVSLDGGSMVFVTIGGVERCRIRAAPTARLADIHLQLVAEHRAGRLGPGAWRVEAILPGGRPLSAAAEETVAGPVPQNRFHKPGSTGLQVPQDRFHRNGSTEMLAAGDGHTVLLRSDGTAVARGDNHAGQCDLPALPAGLTYSQVAAGGCHTVLLRSDGTAVARGSNADGRCDLPALPAGLTYSQVAAGWPHTVLLRSDGTAVARGSNDFGQCDLPALPAGLTYTQVAAGGRHTVLLRSDGTAVACGWNADGQSDLPALPAGLTYTQVAAGWRHTVLLRSDGTAVACGDNRAGQCDLPALPACLTYTQVAAAHGHTVLLRSDGTVVACGWNQYGQCDLPALPAGLTYTQVAAGGIHTVLLRSDGTAVACGWIHGQCDLLALSAGLTFTVHLLPALLLQVSLDGGSLVFVTIGGVERCRIRAAPTARLVRPGAAERLRLELLGARGQARQDSGAHTLESLAPVRSGCSQKLRLAEAEGPARVAEPPGNLVMLAAGGSHAVLLRSDGTAVACGDNHDGQCDLPALPAGLTYTQVAAGGSHTVLLRSDGTAVACGSNFCGQCDLPALPAGLTYTQVAAGEQHAVLLRSDGTAVACGDNRAGQCDLPAQPAGLTYTQVAAGGSHMVLLRSDGTAVACGGNHAGQCDLPALPASLTYTQVATGRNHHTVLLRSDGTAVACGDNRAGQCDLPALPACLTYTQVAAAYGHTVLLRSDGTVVACGWNQYGQCDLPALPAGLTYTQVAAGGIHTVLLRSDGTAVACGWIHGQCDLPALPAGLTYTVHLLPALLLQVSLDGGSLVFATIGGVERCRIRAAPTARLADIHLQLVAEHRAGRLGPGAWRVEAILPGGRPLSSAAAEEPGAAERLRLELLGARGQARQKLVSDLETAVTGYRNAHYRMQGAQAEIEDEGKANRKRVRPFHESLHAEIMGAAESHARHVRLLAEKEMPPVYWEHKVVKAAPEGALVAPVGLYVDGARYGGRAAAGRHKSVVVISLISLLTGVRHPGVLFRKQLQCRCGCKGYCSTQRLWLFTRWCVEALSRGEWPRTGVDDREWNETDGHRRDRAGQPLGFRAAVIYQLVDWEAVSNLLGVPQWNHLQHPCPLCTCTATSMHLYRKVGNGLCLQGSVDRLNADSDQLEAGDLLRAGPIALRTPSHRDGSPRPPPPAHLDGNGDPDKAFGVLNAKLDNWYASERRLGREPDEIDGFNVAMLGTEDAPKLKLRGGEAATLFIFCVECFLPQFVDDIKNGVEILACAKPLLEWVNFLKELSDVPTAAECAHLRVLCLKHLMLCPSAGIVYRIPWLGHPRLYATWKDESLNALFAALAEMAHSGNWEQGVFARLDLQLLNEAGGPRRGQEVVWNKLSPEEREEFKKADAAECELKKLLTSRFHFGKWQVGEAEYAGRRIRQQSDGRILVDQEKYILEQVRPMRLDQERVKCPEELLDAGELRDYRGLVAKILWAARQSRPDVSGSASMLSAECPQVKIASALMANKVARHLRCTASSCLTIWPLDLSAVTMVTRSDAGGPGGPEWWNSGTSCPFAVALVDECAIAEASEGVAVVDAKSLFDTLSKNCGGAKADRRNAIEMAIVRDSMTAEGTVVRWVPHCKMPADALTKVDPGRGNFALTDLMHKGMLALTDESGSLDERSLNLSLKSRTCTQSRGWVPHALLRSDGTVAAWGQNADGQCDVPALEGGVTYTHVAAGGYHTVLLRSDGTVAACGHNAHGQCDVPALEGGGTYTHVAAGAFHTVLLRSDGTVAACGRNANGQCDVPALEGGVTYTHVAAGAFHTVLLRSDGTVAACGRNANGQCDVPALEGGGTYTHVAAGAFHTVLLRSDGTVAAWGQNAHGQCDVPALEGGGTYTHVAAGGLQTVLLRSDGTVAACGQNVEGQCDVPALEGGVTYTARLFGVNLLLQASFDGVSLRFLTLGGVERCRLLAAPGALLADVHHQLLAEHAAGRLGPGFDRVDAVLPARAVALRRRAPLPSAGLAPLLPCRRMVAAGGGHTVLLRSDGTVAACGQNTDGQCDVPALEGGGTCTHVAAGAFHTVLFRSDGTVAAWGQNADGQCDVPALEGGVTYTHVAAGGYHTVLLRSDGTVAACGHNAHGQCDVPALEGGVTYTHVAAGGRYTVLFRSDGTVAACGQNAHGQCDVPALEVGRRDLHARRRGCVPHCPAPERRHGRGLRPESGSPVRRAGAGGRRDLYRAPVWS